MEEAKNEYKITFGPYEIELVKSQVYFRKNGSLMKAMPVKSTFGLYDLKKLANKIAKSVNMTSKLPKDVLKAEKDNKRDLLKGIDESSEQWLKTIKALAKKDQLSKISAKDKKTLLKIVRLVKTANEAHPSLGTGETQITPVKIIQAGEDELNELSKLTFRDAGIKNLADLRLALDVARDNKIWWDQKDNQQALYFKNAKELKRFKKAYGLDEVNENVKAAYHALLKVDKGPHTKQFIADLWGQSVPKLKKLKDKFTKSYQRGNIWTGSKLDMRKMQYIMAIMKDKGYNQFEGKLNESNAERVIHQKLRGKDVLYRKFDTNGKPNRDGRILKVIDKRGVLGKGKNKEFEFDLQGYGSGDLDKFLKSMLEGKLNEFGTRFNQKTGNFDFTFPKSFESKEDLTNLKKDWKIKGTDKLFKGMYKLKSIKGEKGTYAHSKHKIALTKDDFRQMAKLRYGPRSMPSGFKIKVNEGKLNEGDKGYFVWSGTYGKDDPKKMKSLHYVKDLKASMKATQKNKAKHGNARAMLGSEFKKQFPKAYKQYQGSFAQFFEIKEDFVRSGHMYKSLTYKVTDSKAVMAAYKKFKAGNRTINMVVKASGDTITISGHPTKGMWMSPGIADQLDVAIQKTGKATLVKSDSKKLKENKMNESEIKFRKMIREMAEPMLKASMNEISTKAGLEDVMKGRTTSIEGIKFSKELATNLLFWIKTSPYGRKYGKHILKGRIASLIGPANAMGFGDRLKAKLKGEWKAIVQKHGPKREDVVKELKELKEAHKSDSEMLKLAAKGIKAARVGSAAGKAYLDSLKNSWRLSPRDKKDYMDFTVDDWEEDVLYYIQNKG